jgi:hypothetical protein
MRTVVLTHPGILELNWMWLPTWIGSNAVLKRKIEEELGDKIVGRPLTEAELDEINDEVIDLLEHLNPTVEGLREYLDGLKFVKFTCREPTASTSGSTRS